MQNSSGDVTPFSKIGLSPDTHEYQLITTKIIKKTQELFTINQHIINQMFD